MSIKPEFKIIADHLRSSCFLIADGVLPSNEGRGYVLRRIMRRAMRQIHKLNGKEALMYKLAPHLINEMSQAYPELETAQDLIIETLKNEEQNFRLTLVNGLKILEEELAKTKGKFSGEIAFKLHDTYGFPLDLTQDILKEKSVEVDVAEFSAEMEKQKNRAKENWSGSGEVKEDDFYFKIAQKLGKTEFLGYQKITSEAKIVAIIKENKEIQTTKTDDKNILIILDQTPFYATSGGQKGDDGKITSSLENFINIVETKKFGTNLHFHLALEIKGNFKVGDKIIAHINEKTRQSRAQNHSATHLLHKALKELLGNQITQKGSNVDCEYFSFDFNFNRGLTDAEIEQIEDLVNFYIRQNSEVKTQIMNLEKAKESGAMALFGEKYDSEVRVLAMGTIENDKNWSVELCGGTHVKRTGDIGLFVITSEKGIASGIRRIEAKTANYAIEFLRAEQRKIERAKEETLNQTKQKDKEIEKLKKQILFSKLDNLNQEKIGEVTLIHNVFIDIEAKDLREITTEITKKKEFQNDCIFAFFATKDGKVSTCIAISNNLTEKFDANNLIKPVIEKLGGKGGGGSKTLAMGGGIEERNIKESLEYLKKSINS